MLTEIKRVSADILTLLNTINRQISIEEFHYFLDEPYFLINFSLNYLIREGIVEKELKENKIYISAVANVPMRVISFSY